MNFDDRQADRLQGIEDSHGRVGIAAGVDDDALGLAARLLHPADDFAFDVGLTEIYCQAVCGGRLFRPERRSASVSVP